MRYDRVVIQFGGAAMSGPEPVGLDVVALEQVADQVLAVPELGVQVAVVVGGGNFFRGSLAEHRGVTEPRPTPSASSARGGPCDEFAAPPPS
jgi:uridylate kinase